MHVLGSSWSISLKVERRRQSWFLRRPADACDRPRGNALESLLSPCVARCHSARRREARRRLPVFPRREAAAKRPRAGSEDIRLSDVHRALTALDPNAVGPERNLTSLGSARTLATMQLADSFELAYVRMIIAAVAGVLIVSVGSRGIRSGSFVSRSGGMNRLLLWMTTTVYAVSWFLP